MACWLFLKDTDVVVLKGDTVEKFNFLSYFSFYYILFFFLFLFFRCEAKGRRVG